MEEKKEGSGGLVKMETNTEFKSEIMKQCNDIFKMSRVYTLVK